SEIRAPTDASATEATCPPDAVLCENFESATIDGSRWSMRGPTQVGSLSIDTAPVPAPGAGPRALHVAFPALPPAGVDGSMLKTTFMTPKLQVYLRMFVWIGADAQFFGNSFFQFDSDRNNSIYDHILDDAAFEVFQYANPFRPPRPPLRSVAFRRG